MGQIPHRQVSLIAFISEDNLHFMEFDDLALFGERIGAVLKEEGPVFVKLKLVPSETAYAQDW